MPGKQFSVVQEIDAQPLGNTEHPLGSPESILAFVAIFPTHFKDF
jgi:hypothetical protein